MDLVKKQSLHWVAFNHVVNATEAQAVFLESKQDLNRLNTFKRTPLDEANAVLIMRGEYSNLNPFIQFLRKLGAKEGTEMTCVFAA